MLNYLFEVGGRVIIWDKDNNEADKFSLIEQLQSTKQSPVGITSGTLAGLCS